MSGPVVVLGWDSATFDVADPLMRAGRLPALAGLVERGHRAPLRSTLPAMTDCAWTSAFTGCNPGAHGIFGSWYRAPGAYRCRYFSGRDRRAPALWELAPGRRHLVWNVPMTYPPEPVNGVMVSGYGAPPGSRFCAPGDFQRELARRFALEDLLDRAPHGDLLEFRDDLLRGLEVQAEALPWAAEAARAEVVVAVWPHIDRAQHFFWRFRGTNHPLADAIERVYEAADAATAGILERFPEADVLVVSDHGAGPLRGDVNLGAWLVANGYAAWARRSPSPARLAWALPPSLRRLGRRLAPSLARRAMSAALAGQLAAFDWERTRAFVGIHSDVWLNLRGREEQGVVPPGDAPGLVEELRAGLGEITDPDTGQRVFAACLPGAELYRGPARGLAPDLVVDGWTTGYRVAPGRGPGPVVGPPAPLTGAREAWSGDHRPLGLLVAAGPRIAPGTTPELSLLDIAPTVLALLDEPVPEGLDGRVATELIAPQWLSSHPLRTGAPAHRAAPGGDLSADEAEAVASHLRDLGYIE